MASTSSAPGVQGVPTLELTDTQAPTQAPAQPTDLSPSPLAPAEVDPNHVNSNKLLQAEVEYLQLTPAEVPLSPPTTMVPMLEADNRQDQGLPIDLTWVVSTFLNNNLDVKLAELDKKRAQTLVTQAFSEFLPSVGLTVGTGSYNGVVQVFDSSLQPALIQNRQAMASITLPVNLGGKTLFEYRASKRVVEVQDQKIQAERIKSLSVAVQKYYDLQYAHAQRDVAQRSFEEVNKQLDMYQNHFQAGIRPKLDQLDTKYLLYQRNLELSQAQQDLRTAQYGLAQVLNMPLPTNGYRLKEKPLERHPLFDDQTLEAVVEHALRENPQVQSANAEIRYQRERMRATKAALFPTVELSAYGSVLGNFDNEYRGNRFGGVQLSWDVLQNMGVKQVAKIKEQGVLLERAQIEQERANQTVRSNVQQVYAALDGARQRIQLGENNIDNALEGYEHAFNRFYEGEGSYLEVNNALNHLNQLRQNYAGAVIEYKLNQLLLQLAAGNLDALTRLDPQPVAVVAPSVVSPTTAAVVPQPGVPVLPKPGLSPQIAKSAASAVATK